MPFDRPWAVPWPANELEYVTVCPVCGCTSREVLHGDLIDNVCFVALGYWTMFRCNQCCCAYLDPRPSPASINKAYGTYYTHNVEMPREEVNQLSGFRRWRRMLANGYINQCYGTSYQPASALGTWVAVLLPQQRQAMDVQFRYLPKPKEKQRLLDIGCGNGSFLERARHAGWDVLGLEPDPKAADAARQRGFNVVVGTIDELSDVTACFDAITLSHVIEHVYWPFELMMSVHRLLKPGGVVYIDTPNINSHGAKVFGGNWRGLETPRHLVLFNPASLKNLLTAAGFNLIKMKRRTAVAPFMCQTSLQMQQGNFPHKTPPSMLSKIEKIKMRLMTPTENLEFITLTAIRTGI